MTQKEITVTRTLSADAKHTMMEIVHQACAFKSTILLKTPRTHVNAKSLLGMFTLVLAPGMKLLIQADGIDEVKAITAMENYFS